MKQRNAGPIRTDCQRAGAGFALGSSCNGAFACAVCAAPPWLLLVWSVGGRSPHSPALPVDVQASALPRQRASNLPNGRDARVVVVLDCLAEGLIPHQEGKKLSPHMGHVPYVLCKVTLCPPLPCKVRWCFPRAFKGNLHSGQCGWSSVGVPAHSRLLLSCAASCSTCASNCIMRLWISSSTRQTSPWDVLAATL